MPTKTDAGWFDDAAALTAPGSTDLELARLWASMIRADLAEQRPGAALASARATSPYDKVRIGHAIGLAMEDADLVAWIEQSAERKRRAVAIAEAFTPPDPGALHNARSLPALGSFSAFAEYPYALIIVPGYTPRDAASPVRLHPVAKRRLAQAHEDLLKKQAPFILVSGANVYPRGTTYYEGIEMKEELVRMGVDDTKVIVDARARHSTTNLRNAARVMVSHGLSRGLITTVGGGVLGSDLFDQDFYFSNPGISTFHGRCERELGYRVGELADAGPAHSELRPSPRVMERSYRDPLDP